MARLLGSLIKISPFGYGLCFLRGRWCGVSGLFSFFYGVGRRAAAFFCSVSSDLFVLALVQPVVTENHLCCLEDDVILKFHM